MKPFIFSKQSMEKQIELQDDRTGWIRWLRELFVEQARNAIEQAQLEMQRQRPEGEEKPDTYDEAVTAVFSRFADSAEFMGMLRECANAAVQVKTQAYTRPITLDDVAKSKVIFDIYIRLKAAAYVQGQIASGALKADPATPADEALAAE